MPENSSALLARSMRERDYDRYLVALFTPTRQRGALFALIAFNYELARIVDVVSEPMLGEIRLQWWREVIAAIYEDTPIRKHDVTEVLAQAVRQYSIPRAPLDRMIDTRAQDFADEPPRNLVALEAYAEGTAGALNEAMIAVFGGETPETVKAASHVGAAWALVGLLRAAPANAAQGRLFLPQDALANAGIGRGSILAGTAWPDIASDVIEPICMRARARLAEGRALKNQVPRSARKALLSARLADIYLSRLSACGYDLGALKQQPRILRPLFNLSVAAMRGRY